MVNAGDFELRLNIMGRILPDKAWSNVHLDNARRLQTGQVPGVTDAAGTSSLAFVIVPGQDGNGGNDEHGANRQQCRNPSHPCHVKNLSPSRR